MSRMDFLCGLDLAKRHDYAALVVARRTPLMLPPVPEPPEGEEAAGEEEADPLLLRVTYAFQYPRGTDYHDIADHAEQVALDPHYRGRINFGLDVTGVGEAVLEMFERRPALAEITWAVSISPGQRASRSKTQTMRFSVPKKDLIGAVQANLQRGRLVACPLDPVHMDLLRSQLYSLKRKPRPEKRTAAIEAEHEADHDDIALGLAVLAWLSDWIPLEDQGEWGEFEPYTLIEGVQPNVNRPAPSWRGGDDPLSHRPAGSAPDEPRLPTMATNPPVHRRPLP